MLAAQLFEGLGVRRPAGFRLFAGGEHQLFKQDLAELLRGVDVELLAREGVDLLLQRVDADGELLPVVVQRLPVDEKARPLHVGQHIAQRQLHFVHEGRHALVFELLLHRRVQGEDRLGSLLFLAQQLLRQARQLVAALGRVEQIAAERRVEDEAAG